MCALWYVRNDDFHRDLKIVKEEVLRFAQKHETRLHKHVIFQLHDQHVKRRLKRVKPSDLVLFR